MHSYFGKFIVPLYSYNLFLALAFLGGILTALFHGPKIGISRPRVLDMAVWFVLSAFLGARMVYVFLFPERFPTVMSWFDFQSGGLVFFGGFFATTLVIMIYCHVNRIDLRNAGDMIAPSLAFGHFVGRLGCFMSGCCYGAVTIRPWGIVFPRLGETVARHPTQLYEAGILFFLFLWTSKKLLERAVSEGFQANTERSASNVPVPGLIWGYYVLAYSGFRFLVEFLRDDLRGGFFTPLHLSPSQLIALGATAFALGWLRYCSQSGFIPLKSASQETIAKG